MFKSFLRFFERQENEKNIFLCVLLRNQRHFVFVHYYYHLFSSIVRNSIQFNKISVASLELNDLKNAH